MTSPTPLTESKETAEQANIRFATQNIWKTLPFTKIFIERHIDIPENAECILRKLDEYHQKLMSLLTTQHTKEKEEMVREIMQEFATYDGFSMMQTREKVREIAKKHNITI